MNGVTRRSPRLLILVALATLSVAAGCGGGNDNASDTSASTATTAATTAPTTALATPPTTGSSDSAGGDVCAGLKKVADLDQETKRLLGESENWDTVRSFLVTESPKVLEGYGQAVEGAPPDVAADISILLDFTTQSIEAARESSSLTDFASKAAALPGAGDAGAAGQRLDSFARTNCGFGVS